MPPDPLPPLFNLWIRPWFWVVSPRNLTSFTRPFLAGRRSRGGGGGGGGHETRFFVGYFRLGTRLYTSASALESFDSALYTGTGGPVEQFPSGVLPAILHLALLELVTSGFCSAVLRFVKCEVGYYMTTDLLISIIRPIVRQRPEDTASLNIIC